jgi:hypothetical protein
MLIVLFLSLQPDHVPELQFPSTWLPSVTFRSAAIAVTRD